MDFVLSADAGEDTVDQPNPRFAGRNEAAHLRQQDDQGDLTQKGGFTAHDFIQFM